MRKPDPKSEAARKRRLAYGALLLAAIGTFRERSRNLLLALAHGDCQADAWASAYVSLIIDLHAQASYVGRGIAGTFTGEPVVFNPYDQMAGAAMGLDQSRFVQGFRQDLKEGKYADPETGVLDPDKAMPRVELYANRARGTANTTAVRESGDGFDIYWRLGRTEDHCESCPVWAAGGPYSRFTLPAVPGDGKSECGTNCLCFLEIDGEPIDMLARP